MFVMHLKELKQNSKLNQSLKLNIRCLFAGLVMMGIAVLLFAWAYFIAAKDLGKAQNFTELLASSEMKEGIYTELVVTDEPFVFAEYDDSLTSDKFYFLWNGNLTHIGYLDYSTYND